MQAQPEVPPYIGAANTATRKYTRPDTLIDNPDAVVIGSGIGGLGIAALLARRKGWRVLVLEANDVPGGCTRCHEIDGFEFNSGIDSIGDMDASVGRGIVRPTIDYLTEGRLQWAEMPDLHEVASVGGEDYHWYSDPEKNKAWMLERFPTVSREDLERYYKLEEKVEVGCTGWALTKILPRWIPRFVRELLHRVFGRIWLRYLHRSTLEVLRDEFGFPKELCGAISYMYGNYGATPSNAPFAFHAINLLHYRYGSYYPVGGPSYILECIMPTIEKRGGQLAPGCPVDEILIEGNRAVGVRLTDGTEVHSKRVISGASAYTTLMDLLPADVSQRHGYPARFEQLGPSPTHLYYFLGYDEVIDLPAHIIWHLPDYDIDAADRRYKEEMDFESGQACYILCPSARDPAFQERFPGKSTVIVLAEAPSHWVTRQQEDPAFKADLEAKIDANFTRVLEQHIPALRGKTPRLKKLGVPIGCNPWAWQHASYGLEGSKRRFVDHTHWLGPRTEVKGLYLTGQDAFAPGFSGAMIGARVCYSAVTGNIFHMARGKIGLFP
jgi:all-trans-retinol 13,14-reductase